MAINCNALIPRFPTPPDKLTLGTKYYLNGELLGLPVLLLVGHLRGLPDRDHQLSAVVSQTKIQLVQQRTSWEAFSYWVSKGYEVLWNIMHSCYYIICNLYNTCRIGIVESRAPPDCRYSPSSTH